MKPEIDNIFLDTSLFVKENFLEGTRINSIFNLSSKKYFNFYISIITLNEIKSQYKKRITAAVEKHNQLINDKSNDIRVLRNNKSGDNILQKFPKIKDLCSEFDKNLEDALDRAGATILGYPVLNVADVFSQYFSGLPPFNKAEKKAEFPDAFAIAHVQLWCDENSASAIILTQDKDFAKHGCPGILVDYEYEKYVEDKLKLLLADRIDLLKKIYTDKSTEIDKEILDYVRNELENEWIYVDAVNYMDVHEISIDKLTVLAKDYEITVVNDDYIEIELNAHIHYKVILNVDDEESGMWDSEDKVVLWRETTEKSLEDSNLIIPVKISFNIIDSDDYDDDPQIEEINNSKDIQIKSPLWYD